MAAVVAWWHVALMIMVKTTGSGLVSVKPSPATGAPPDRRHAWPILAGLQLLAGVFAGGTVPSSCAS